MPKDHEKDCEEPRKEQRSYGGEKPPIEFIIKKKSPSEVITPEDIPPGLTAEDVM